jgi:Domain of unknown function (DUF4126)
LNSLIALVAGIGLAYAAGVSLYATVAVTGLAVRFGWISGTPSTIAALGGPWVIGIASVMALVEFSATLVPGVSSAWETVHSLIRPPAAAILAAGAVWHADPIVVLIAALLGGTVAIVTHTAKLGLRYAIDAEPVPVKDAVANTAELVLVAAVSIGIWHSPFLTLGVALIVLLLLVILVRPIGRALHQVFSGHWMPARGLMQAPRVTGQPGPPEPEDEL